MTRDVGRAYGVVDDRVSFLFVVSLIYLYDNMTVSHAVKNGPEFLQKTIGYTRLVGDLARQQLSNQVV